MMRKLYLHWSAGRITT